MNFEKYKEEFESYAKEMMKCEEGAPLHYMEVKLKHTMGVVAAAERIAKSINLEGEDLELAKLCALMHDVGRFPQIAKYKNDNDLITENHALLSVKTIKEKGMLHEDDLTNDLVLKAVEYHNMNAIPDEEKDEKVIMHAKILRDADKVDIYRAVVEEVLSLPLPELKELYSDLSFEEKTSDAIYEGYMNGTLVPKSEVKTMLDHNLLQLGWIIDGFYFKETGKIIAENNYPSRMFEQIEMDDKAREIYDKAMRILEEC